MTIKKGDLTITVEGEDMLKVLDRMGVFGTATAASPQNSISAITPQPPEKKRNAAIEEEMDRFRRFLRVVGKRPRDVLDVLYEHVDGMSDKELVERLTRDEGKPVTLAGRMTALTKQVTKVGLNLERVLVRNRLRDRESGANMHYELGPIARRYFDQMASEAASEEISGQIFEKGN